VTGLDKCAVRPKFARSARFANVRLLRARPAAMGRFATINDRTAAFRSDGR